MRGSSRVPAKVQAAHRSTADLLEEFAEGIGEAAVSLEEAVSALRDRGTPGLLLIFAAPQLLPLPLGFSNILALPLVVVAIQMVLGVERVWLPAWLRRRRLSAEKAKQAAQRVAGWLRRIERVVRPRYWYFAGQRGRRTLGVATLLLVLVLVTPLPLTGWLPAFALLLMGLGSIERDGLLIFASLGLCVVALAVWLGWMAGFIYLDDVLADMGMTMALGLEG